MDAFQQPVNRLPISTPPLRFGTGRRINSLVVNAECALHERVDILGTGLLGRYLVRRQVAEESTRMFERVSDSAGSKSVTPECVTELAQMLLEVWDRRPLSLRHAKEVMNRRRVVRSPMVLIVRDLSMAQTICLAMSAQIPL